MSEFSKFDIYSLNTQMFKSSVKDDVDIYVDFLSQEDDFEAVKSYLLEHFENVDNNWFEYDKINKTCYVSIKEDRIEFCAQKNHQDYFGKGWLKVKEG